MSGVKRIADGRAKIRYGMRNLALATSVIAAQIVSLVLLSLAVGAGYHQYAYGDVGPVAVHIGGGLLVALFNAVLSLHRKAYTIESYLDRARQPSHIFIVWNVAFMALAGLAFLTKTTADFSRGWVLLFYGSGLVLMLAVDVVARSMVVSGLASGTIAPRRLLAIGTEREVSAFTSRIATAGNKIQGMAVAIVSAVTLPDGLLPSDMPTVGRLLDQGVAKARAMLPDDVVILSGWTEIELIERCVDAFTMLPVAIRLDGGVILDRVEDVQIGHIGNAATVSLKGLPLSPIELVAKRVFDIVGAAVLLVCAVPLLVAVALAIKWDSPGPIFFRQRRLGFNQQPFDIWKFRSMTSTDNGDVIRQAKADDARITFVGRFLRRANFDELPQLINVLKGEMSLVGPRPHAIAHDRDWEKRVQRYPRRLNMKPGITGWAQVNGFRGELDTQEKLGGRVEHDLYYIDHWSIAFDAYILIMTVFSPRAFRNAR
jgi:polysaccharide biosynthesis protein PslA